MLSVLAETLAANLRPWCDIYQLPNYITVFEGSGDSGDNCKFVLKQLLSACNFTVPLNASQVSELMLHTASGLERWGTCGCRMVLLVAKDTALNKIVEKTNTITMAQISGGQELPYRGQVFLWTRKKYSEAMPVEYIAIPPAPQKLTDEQTDALRGFIAKLLSIPDPSAEDAMSEFNEICQSSVSYRKNPTVIW